MSEINIIMGSNDVNFHSGKKFIFECSRNAKTFEMVVYTCKSDILSLSHKSITRYLKPHLSKMMYKEEFRYSSQINKGRVKNPIRMALDEDGSIINKDKTIRDIYAQINRLK